MKNTAIIALMATMMTMMINPHHTSASQPVSGHELNIWEGTPVKDKVKMTCYPTSPGSPAIIICPGGSYFWHARNTEGHNVARWLNDNGIAAFVLEYRTAGINAFIYHTRWFYRGHRYPDMMEDIQRAISLLRTSPEKFGIDPNTLGVMGFSAGGHLAVMAGINFDTDFLAAAGVKNEVSLRPDFIAPLYPVVSMTHPSTHRRSRRGLLGENNQVTPQMKDSLSLEKHVRPDMPPVFLMNCKDDPTVDWRNSALLDSALTSGGVPHTYIRFETGGHGFGVTASKTSTEAAQWPQMFLDWFNSVNPQKIRVIQNDH